MQRVCLVHYHEIGLKGRNRLQFERRLRDNLEATLDSSDVEKIERISGHLCITLHDEGDAERVREQACATPGVVRVSVGWRCSRDLDRMCSLARDVLLASAPFETFKVAAHRSNTDFEVDSMEMNRLIGAYLCEAAPEAKVRMKDPDVVVHVDVVQGSAYVYAQTYPGIGGLPVGSAGRVVSLLSAGIDSPVATWRMVHRGAIAICVHFSGRPQTGTQSEELVADLIEQLAPAAGIARLYVIPFGDYQRQISLRVPPKLRVIMYRRLMLAVAERIAQGEHAGALVTGESLGQVASQTLSNIRATDEVCKLPVFRPLIGADKQEIMTRARKLGTYDISIQNQEDCCTLFMPRNPETHAHLDEVHAAWGQLPVDEWTDRIVADAEVHDCFCPSYHAQRRQGVKR
jgi:thiamine biosynthesis protein ThiI